MIALTLDQLREATGADLVRGRHPSWTALSPPTARCRPGSPVRRPPRRTCRRTRLRVYCRRGRCGRGAGERPLEGIPTLVTDDVQTAFGRIARAVK